MSTNLPDQVLFECEHCRDALPECYPEDYAHICAHLRDGAGLTYVRSPDHFEVAAWCTHCDAQRPTEGVAVPERCVLCMECFISTRLFSVECTNAGKQRGYELFPPQQLRADSRPMAIKLRPGCLAKVCFSPVPSRRSPPYVESMWVRVQEREGDTIRGVLDNDPVIAELPQLGDPVEFNARHVLAGYDFPNQPAELDHPHWCRRCDEDSHSGLDSHDVALLADVRAFGWHALVVSAEDKGEPSWAFTVGLQHVFGHPEFVVFGLEFKLMVSVLNRLGARVRNGEVFESGDAVDDLLEGGHCTTLREIREEESFEEYLGYGCWFYQRLSFPALQVVWSDAEGNVPFGDGFDEELAKQQPLLP